MGVTQLQTEPEMPAQAGIGHNKPPMDESAKEDFASLYREKLTDSKVTDQRRTDLIDAADRAEITSEETLAAGAATIRQMRAIATIITETHKETKQPYLDAGRAVDAEKKALLDPLTAAKTKVETKQKAYVTKRENERRERERKEAERIVEEERKQQEAARKAEEERLAAIEAGKPAPPPPPPPPAPVESKPITGLVDKGPIRNADGGSVSAGVVKVPTVTDYVQAFAFVQSNQKVREAVDKAVAGLVRSGLTEIPGVDIREEAKVNNR